jgi:hypothetical protein
MGRGVRAALLVVVLVGCGIDRRYGPQDNPTTIRDVTGVDFGWVCDDQGCKVTRLATTPAPDPCPNPQDSAYGDSWGRFVEVCSVCLGHEPGFYWSTTPGQCRVLACATDANCPSIYESNPEAGYACVNGLCQNIDTVRWPRDKLTYDMVEQMCFAVHPRPETAAFASPAAMAVQHEVDASCPLTATPEPCPLPADCRMP